MPVETIWFLACGSVYAMVCLVVAIALVRAGAQADKRRIQDVRVLRWDEEEDPRHWNR